MYVLLTDFRFVGPTDERYVTGGGRPSVTLCDEGVGRALRVTPKKIFYIFYMYNMIL